MKIRTVVPLLVLMMVRSVSVKLKLPAALAAVYRDDTNLESGSERPSSILRMKIFLDNQFPH
jgi:hypothetical protein